MGIVIKLFFDKEQSDLNVVLLKNADKRNTLAEAGYDVVADLKVSLDDLCDGMVVDECEPQRVFCRSGGSIRDGDFSDDSNHSCVTIPFNSERISDIEDSDSAFLGARNYVTNGEYIIVDPPHYTNSSDSMVNHSVDRDNNSNSRLRASTNQVDLDSPDCDEEPYRLAPRRSVRQMKKIDTTNDVNVARNSEAHNDMLQNSSYSSGNHSFDGVINSNSDPRASKSRVDASSSGSDSEPLINLISLDRRLRRSARNMKETDDGSPSQRLRRSARNVKGTVTRNDLNTVTDGQESNNKCRNTSATNSELAVVQKENLPLLPHENTTNSICTLFDIEDEIMKENDAWTITPRRVLRSPNSVLTSDVSQVSKLCDINQEKGKGVNEYEKSFMDSISARASSPKQRFKPEDICKHHSHICSFCGRQFPKAPALIEHERVHTGEKPFSCDKCAYKCASKPNLSRHKRIHSEQKAYTCAICGHGANLKDTLQQHMTQHTGEKAFKCRHCNFKTRQRSNLRIHELRHTGKKSFVCDVCDYCCVLKSDLIKHCSSHMKPQLMQCEHCGHKCMDKWSMCKHIWSYCEEFQNDLSNQKTL